MEEAYNDMDMDSKSNSGDTIPLNQAIVAKRAKLAAMVQEDSLESRLLCQKKNLQDQVARLDEALKLLEDHPEVERILTLTKGMHY